MAHAVAAAALDVLPLGVVLHLLLMWLGFAHFMQRPFHSSTMDILSLDGSVPVAFIAGLCCPGGFLGAVGIHVQVNLHDVLHLTHLH